MVRPPYFDSNGLKKGAWNEEEDNKLKAFILEFGLITTWRLVPLFAGLRRSGKSCRLRWVNYLRSDLKKEKFTKNEEDLFIELHDRLGNKWSTIATYFPGRTDNDIKNYWNAHIKKRLYKQKGAIRPKVIRPQIAHEDQSSKINYFITTDHQEKPASENVFLQGLFSTEDSQNIHALNSITYPYSVAEPYHEETCLSQLNIDDLPPILEEEFGDFGLCQNDTPTFSDSSNGGITSWNSSVQSLANFWSELLEKGTIDMV